MQFALGTPQAMRNRPAATQVTGHPVIRGEVTRQPGGRPPGRPQAPGRLQAPGRPQAPRPPTGPPQGVALIGVNLRPCERHAGPPQGVALLYTAAQ